MNQLIFWCVQNFLPFTLLSLFFPMVFRYEFKLKFLVDLFHVCYVECLFFSLVLQICRSIFVCTRFGFYKRHLPLEQELSLNAIYRPSSINKKLYQRNQINLKALSFPPSIFPFVFIQFRNSNCSVVFVI